ncbi:Fur-regulated basic protein FbpA [Oceanobacillus salinisoli]|uniref:Fur-regulated basic protein FbpA n=1 Tax=Oceanobacillus salinisoli TaxID=2678611 RepID=UPI0012E10368|nr:Fur-regulated basic protein FbpA [Oceanobacillus salinisoli]
MGLLNEKVSNRRNELIHELRKMGVVTAKSGLSLENVSLADLEWMNIEEKNRAAKEYREKKND